MEPKSELYIASFIQSISYTMSKKRKLYKITNMMHRNISSLW